MFSFLKWAHRSAACAVIALALPSAASAQSSADSAPPPAPAVPFAEVWAGADAFKRVWALYSGADFAPFGSIRQDGWRLRAVGGYGQYEQICDRFGTMCQGSASFMEALGGYRWQYGRWTFKALAGVTTKFSGGIRPDGALLDNDRSIGAKAVFESWLDLDSTVWLALDAAYSTLKSNPSLQARIGYRITPALSLGVGASASSLLEQAADAGHFHTFRAGPLVRYEWETGEASLTGGMAALLERQDGQNETTVSPFATVNVLFRY